MTKAEKLEAFLKEELYDIYCHNCKHVDNDENDNCDYCHRKNMYWQVSDEVIAKAVEIATEDDAVPVKLTEEEINTIRIHMNAFKEKLCNQNRWKDAEDYQQIVDKLDAMMDEERKDNGDKGSER